VASLDDERLPKKIYPEPGRNAGEVKLLAFTNQFSEAEGIARICKHLIEKKNISPEQILILLRSDSNGVFSREIVEAFGKETPISISKKEGNIFDTTFGRQLIAIFRLLRNREDHLSWRTLIQIRTKNSLGEKAQSDLYNLARENNLGYYGVIIAAINNSIQVGFRDRLLTEYELISSLINSVNEVVNSGQNPLLQVKQIIDFVLPEEYKQPMIQFFMELIEKENPSSISDLIGKLESSQINDWNVEQEIEKGKVNVLTMHRAKGLTADIVFIVGAEDQLIPGSNDKEPELGDERRLLFVSLTRAKHKLYITYCKDRTGAQQYSGRNPGTSRHNLTQFLTDSPLHPVSGEKYTNSLST
jgi:superfamily I DNA/RNA helicase